MRIAEFRDLIEIKNEVMTPDGQGGFERSYKTASREWAKVTPLFQIEALIAGQVDSGAILKAVVRHPSKVSPKSRIVYDGNAYRVAGAIKYVDGQRRYREFQLRGENAESQT